MVSPTQKEEYKMTTETITANRGNKTFNAIVTLSDGERATLAPKYRSRAAARAAIALYLSGTYISFRQD